MFARFLNTLFGEPITENVTYKALQQSLENDPSLNSEQRNKLKELNKTTPNEFFLQEQIADFLTLSEPEDSKESMEEIARRYNRREDPSEDHYKKFILFENILYQHAINNNNPVFQRIAIETLARMASRGAIVSIEYLRKLCSIGIIKANSDMTYALCILMALEVDHSFSRTVCAELATLKEIPHLDRQHWQHIADVCTAAMVPDDFGPATLIPRDYANKKAHYVSSQYYLGAAKLAETVADKLRFYQLAGEQALLVKSDPALRILAEIVPDLRALKNEEAVRKRTRFVYVKTVDYQTIVDEENIEKCYTHWKDQFEIAISGYKKLVREISIQVTKLRSELKESVKTQQQTPRLVASR